MLRTKLRNMREMEVYLNTDCSDIDFTVVRPPGLSRGASSGKLFIQRKTKLHVERFHLDRFTRQGSQIGNRRLLSWEQLEDASSRRGKIHGSMPAPDAIFQKGRRDWSVMAGQPSLFIRGPICLEYHQTINHLWGIGHPAETSGNETVDRKWYRRRQRIAWFVSRCPEEDKYTPSNQSCITIDQLSYRSMFNQL